MSPSKLCELCPRGPSLQGQEEPQWHVRHCVKSLITAHLSLIQNFLHLPRHFVSALSLFWIISTWYEVVKHRNDTGMKNKFTSVISQPLLSWSQQCHSWVYLGICSHPARPTPTHTVHHEYPFHLSLTTPYEAGGILPTSQIRKLRLRDGMWLTEGFPGHQC